MTTAMYLNRSDVFALAEGVDLAGGLTRTLLAARADQAGQLVRSELVLPDGAAILGIMPAFSLPEAPRFSAKVVCVVPGNPARGLPAHQGLVLLYDAESGRLLLMADAGAVTEVRTAGLTALATATLRPDAKSVLIVGAGHQAGAHARAHRTAGLQVSIWGRRPGAAKRLAVELATDGVDVTPVGHLAEAVQSVDVITTVTGAVEPVLRHEWILPGTLLNAIGSSTPRVSEVPAETLREAFIVVDDEEAVLRLSGELNRLPDPKPHLTPLADILDGAVGLPAGSVVVFKSVGVPLQDLALADALLKAASERNFGQHVQL